MSIVELDNFTMPSVPSNPIQYLKIFFEQFIVKAHEPLFPTGLSVVTSLSVCVQMAATMEAAILPVCLDAKLRRRL